MTSGIVPAGIARQFDGALAQRLVALRRAIHAHPELSFKETETAARLDDARENFHREKPVHA